MWTPQNQDDDAMTNSTRRQTLSVINDRSLSAPPISAFGWEPILRHHATMACATNQPRANWHLCAPSKNYCLCPMLLLSHRLVQKSNFASRPFPKSKLVIANEKRRQMPLPSKIGVGTIGWGKCRLEGLRQLFEHQTCKFIVVTMVSHDQFHVRRSTQIYGDIQLVVFA